MADGAPLRHQATIWGLIHNHTVMYNVVLARAATTTDAFNAVAEPRRREILDVLAGGERPVGDLVRGEGRQRLYRLNAEALRPIHDWVSGYERFWSGRLGRLDAVLEDLKRQKEAEKDEGGGDGGW